MATVGNERKDRALKLHNEACAAEKLGRLKEALQLIDKAIELYPRASVLWTTKSLFLFDAGRLDAAVQNAERAVEINDKNFYGWLLLAEISKKRGIVKKSANYYKKYVGLREEEWAYTLLASLEADFDRDSAISHAERALELNPDWEEARHILSILKKKK